VKCLTKYYLSKSFWSSIVALLVIVAAGQYGMVITADQTAVFMAVIAMVLRTVTRESIEF
jgi:hypothetical protein